MLDLFLPVALALVAAAGPAAAQTLLPSPYYSGGYGGVLVNPRNLYGSATVVTPGTILNAAPTGSFPASAPCDTSQGSPPLTSSVAPPSAPGTFRPPITPSYRAFTDRFAGSPQPGATDPNDGGCR